MRGWNAVKENYYRDQYFTYVDALREREKVTSGDK